jgi:hypothetical protein
LQISRTYWNSGRTLIQERASNEANTLDPGETLLHDLKRAASFYVKLATSVQKKAPADLFGETKKVQGRVAAVRKD